MNSPQLIIIEARRKALGDEHPDFSGPAGLIEAKHAAQAPPEPPDRPAQADLAHGAARLAPARPDQADLAQGAARIATELRQIADRTCELSEELASLAGSKAPSKDDEGSEEGEGMAGELKAREPGAKD